MLRNYLKTAWRNILREKGNTIINISGLTLGVTCSLLLVLMVMHFSSFDNFHAKRDRIYRIVSQSEGNEGTRYQSGVPTVLPDAFRADFPEAEQVVFTSYRTDILVVIPQKKGDEIKFQEEYGVVYTEPSFFKIFDRVTIIGDPLQNLDDPNEAVISRSLAKKYFGREEVTGEILKVEGMEFKVGAIIEDAPNNTDLPFNLLLSYATIKKVTEEAGWNSTWSDEQCYFLVSGAEDVKKMESRMQAFTDKHIGKDNPKKKVFSFQSLKDMHYDERFEVYSYNTVPKAMLIAFSAIAFILIITACINFINLATAEAVKRSKEVGVRKSLGSSRGQLIRQFLGETTLITALAVLVSIGLTQIALSFLNPFLELELSLNFSNNSTLWMYLIAITVCVSLLSGLYPAFVISGFKPALVLKNQMGNRNSSSYTLRRALVVLQFFISQLLIIVTVVIIYQMDYASKKDLGFTKEAVITAVIPNASEKSNHGRMRTLREEMSDISGVQIASLASAPPSSGNVSETTFKMAGSEDDYITQVKTVDANYIDLYDLELVAGNNLPDLDTASGILVNEKLARMVGFQNPQEIIGKEISLWGKKISISGVIKDFHTVSLVHPIEATVLFNHISNYQTLSVKLDMRKSQQVIAALKSKWEARYPDQLFEYEFLDESIHHFYDGERRMSILFSIFSGIAIFIGCLGLYGLASFMTNQKTKEIGVRKILGASVESILFMFSKEYVKLVFIGFAMAAPLAWLAMSDFLGQFAYKIELGPGVFLIGLITTLLIALVTVGYKSFKTATVNPSRSLRYE
jgi:putative ABC transport system permease protein